MFWLLNNASFISKKLLFMRLLHNAVSPAAGFKFGLGLILLFIIPFLSFGQTKIITGTVKDDAGKPLQGISVSIKNTKTGTQTDAEGRFSLSVARGAILVFSGINFETREQSVSEKPDYIIALKSKTADLS